MDSKIEIVKREIIKPSVPTPTDLCEFKLSQLDQIIPAIYTPFLLFYVGNKGDNNNNSYSDDEDRKFKSNRLKKSLSETLKHFYPFAGRIRDNIVVECSDQGVEYVETNVDAHLSDVLDKPKALELKEFLPIDILSPEAVTGFLLRVQANFFRCGGLAIGICMSHKLADAATLSTFVNAWGRVARGSPDAAVLPMFLTAAMFPPLDVLARPGRPTSMEMNARDYVAQRYVIHPSAIEILKKRAASKTVMHPTTVEVVTGLFWKCAAKAFRTNSTSKNQSSVMVQAMNLRKRFSPTLPENLTGNLVGLFFTAEIDEFEVDVDLQTLVASLRKGRDNYHNQVVEKLQGENDFSIIHDAFKRLGEYANNDKIQLYSCTSWCKFSFYEVDFGWGRPTWVNSGSAAMKNCLVLVDTKGTDGIEVWLSLSEEIMPTFEKDQEILELASSNPKIL